MDNKKLQESVDNLITVYIELKEKVEKKIQELKKNSQTFSD